MKKLSNFEQFFPNRNLYNIKQHFLTTKDGYVVSMFQIKKNLAEGSHIKKNPVLLKHG